MVVQLQQSHLSSDWPSMLPPDETDMFHVHILYIMERASLLWRIIHAIQYLSDPIIVLLNKFIELPPIQKNAKLKKVDK